MGGGADGRQHLGPAEVDGAAAAQGPRPAGQHEGLVAAGVLQELVGLDQRAPDLGDQHDAAVAHLRLVLVGLRRVRRELRVCEPECRVEHGVDRVGIEVRERCHAARIEHDDKGRVTGVVYFDASGVEQRQAARIVCVAGNTIESPRLLLNSASSMFPDGLANSSGQVGRNYMRHVTGSVYSIFERPVRMWRGTTMAGIMQDEARHDPSRGFVGGYELETLSLGLPFMAAFLDPGAWGREFTSAIDGYENMAGMWIVGEDMPQETNRVTVDTAVVDQFGLPTPVVHYDDHPNDVAMRDHAYERGIAIHRAAGAVRSLPTPPYPSTHNIGTNRMSDNPRDGVVNRWGQTHDIPNLFVSDGSQFTTGAAENPTLTIVALAIRQADHIAREMGAGNL